MLHLTSSNMSYFPEVIFPPGYNSTPFGFGENDSSSSPFNGVVANSTQYLLANGTITRSANGMRTMRLPAIFVISYYTFPMLLVLGVISNLLAYLVFTRTQFRKVPSVPYLAAMAVVDSGALVTDFIISGLPQYNIHIISYVVEEVYMNQYIRTNVLYISSCPQSGICQYVTYFNYVFIFLCIWYPVALCVEKFIGVYCPLRKASLCTPFRAKVVVIGMAILAGTCYYYVIYMIGPYVVNKMVFCREWRELRPDFHNLMKLDVIFVIVLPTLVLILLLSLICFRGCEYYRISSAVDLSGGGSNASRGGGASSSSNRASVRVTNVIFPVVLIMLLLKLPFNFMRFLNLTPSTLLHYGHQNLTPVFMYINRFEWAIKLHVYLIFSPSFRRKTLSYLSSVAFVRAKLTGRYNRRRSSSVSEDNEPGRGGAPPRIQLAERIEQGANTRACLMSSDV
ncbi:hypothetical protein Btru_061844 [Bulinus truncatus]|nr:hypothetical protein Btru_061844 [Bulinus truncatus]